MVVETKVKKYTVKKQEVHTVHMVRLFEAPYMRAHSSMEGFYSPSWSYMHLDFSPSATDFAVLPLDIPLASN